jgi:lysozyme
MKDLDLIKREEGCKLNAYRDTRGLWTIGYGHLLDQSVDYADLVWTQAQADEALELDMMDARREASDLPGFNVLNETRQAVLVSMCFQLGSLQNWPHFRAAVSAGRFDEAAEAGMNSLWAKQTPARAQRQMSMLRTGVPA